MAGRRWIPRRCTETSSTSVARTQPRPQTGLAMFSSASRPATGPATAPRPATRLRCRAGDQAVVAASACRSRRIQRRHVIRKAGQGRSRIAHRFRGDPFASWRDFRHRHLGQARCPHRIRRHPGRHNGYSGGHAGYPRGSASPVRSAGGELLNALGSRGIDADRRRPHIGCYTPGRGLIGVSTHVKPSRIPAREDRQ